MHLHRLVLREILHRKGSFLVGVLSVALAVGCLVGAVLAQRSHDLRTESIMERKEAETRERMAQMEDDYRKITVRMGFNVLILPKDLDLAALYADGRAPSYMPEDYVRRLSQSRIVTVNHLLPSLQERVEWTERDNLAVFVIGTRGEVPIAHRNPKKPIQEAVDQGQVVVGHEISRSLGIRPGTDIELLGSSFRVARIHDRRGNRDDITLWLHLDDAQELLGREGKINAILALECHCAGGQLDKVRAEIQAVLPDTQIIEYAEKARGRTEARDRAAKTARDSLEAEREARRHHREELDAYADVLVPIALLGSCFWIGLLALGNVRERASEIGILRALGLRSADVLAVFLVRAAVIGVVGGLLGYPAGFWGGAVWGDAPAGSLPRLFSPLELVAAVGLAPVLAIVASWMPAILAARQDPAVILREE